MPSLEIGDGCPICRDRLGVKHVLCASAECAHCAPQLRGEELKTEDLLEFEKEAKVEKFTGYQDVGPQESKTFVSYVDGKMTNEMALQHQLRMFDDAVHIMKRKRHDYSGRNDPFRNLRDAEFVNVDPLKGVMVRIMDKFARVRSFIEQGELLVNDEAIRDTLVDALNYTSILAAMIEEKMSNERS